MWLHVTNSKTCHHHKLKGLLHAYDVFMFSFDAKHSHSKCRHMHLKQFFRWNKIYIEAVSAILVFRVCLQNGYKKNCHYHFESTRMTRQQKEKNIFLTIATSHLTACSMPGKLTCCRRTWTGTGTTERILIYKHCTMESNCTSKHAPCR